MERKEEIEHAFLILCFDSPRSYKIFRYSRVWTNIENTVRIIQEWSVSTLNHSFLNMLRELWFGLGIAIFWIEMANHLARISHRIARYEGNFTSSWYYEDSCFQEYWNQNKWKSMKTVSPIQWKTLKMKNDKKLKRSITYCPVRTMFL